MADTELVVYVGERKALAEELVAAQIRAGLPKLLEQGIGVAFYPVIARMFAGFEAKWGLVIEGLSKQMALLAEQTSNRDVIAKLEELMADFSKLDAKIAELLDEVSEILTEIRDSASLDAADQAKVDDAVNKLEGAREALDKRGVAVEPDGPPDVPPS